MCYQEQEANIIDGQQIICKEKGQEHLNYML